MVKSPEKRVMVAIMSPRPRTAGPLRQLFPSRVRDGAQGQSPFPRALELNLLLISSFLVERCILYMENREILGGTL